MMLSPIGGIQVNKTSLSGASGAAIGSNGSLSGVAVSGAADVGTSSDEPDREGPPSQSVGRSDAAVATASTADPHSRKSSETVAQQILDALAAMSDVIAAGVVSRSVTTGSPLLDTRDSRASLRLARTVQSYFVF